MSITIAHYAGDGLFFRAEGTYEPMNLLSMVGSGCPAARTRTAGALPQAVGVRGDQAERGGAAIQRCPRIDDSRASAGLPTSYAGGAVSLSMLPDAKLRKLNRSENALRKSEMSLELTM
ncbi:hypothetical protein ABH922_000930 [Rhodococcus sp. 27YEA15]|uniref:hypothetical protein n=1 Tax=Rhodococcus sp. 27YEA15 TaxID=3156259 RepID=UPI003C7CEBD3